METQRVFSDKELAALAMSRLTLAKEAIRRGDKEEAEKLVQTLLH
jgi:hypothetical protein